MALPKALLCLLDADAPGAFPLEARLRAVGFATAVVLWREVAANEQDWMQLLPVLDDAAVQAWVLAGKPRSFTAEIRSRAAMLTLALRRTAPPLTAFVSMGIEGGLEGETGAEAGAMEDVPQAMGHIRLYAAGADFAPRLMAGRVRPLPVPDHPFHCAAHLSPHMGQWLEAGPPRGDTWDGFMLGLAGAEVTAFGVGPRGTVPRTSTLNYPILGVTGERGGVPFHACAARNVLDAGMSCFMRVSGAPASLFVAPYPAEGEQESGVEGPSAFLELI